MTLFALDFDHAADARDFVRALRSVRESGLPPDQIALILGGTATQLVRL